MEKISDISLIDSELVQLRKQVERTFLTVYHDADPEKAWKTNTANYTDLKDLIKERTTKTVSPRFLSKALFQSIHAGGYSSFKIANIDALYRFAYNGKSRDEVVGSQQEAVNDHRRHTFYYIGDKNQFKKALPVIASDLFDHSDHKDRNKVIKSSLLRRAVDDENEVIHILINQDYLESKLGMEDLIEILSRKIQRSFFDNNIQYHFDEALFKNPDGLLRTKGYARLEKYWRELVEECRRNDDNANTDETAKELKEYENILTSLAPVRLALKQIFIQDPEPLRTGEEFNIEGFVPHIRKIKKLTEQSLYSIYERMVNESFESQMFAYLCVIGYDKFYEVNERDRNDYMDRETLLSYFLKFNSVLKAHAIIRLFTIPGTPRRKKNWQSSLPRKQNLNLFSFAYMNARTAKASFLLMYDPVRQRRNVLAGLDYVIRIPIPASEPESFKPELIGTPHFMPDIEHKESELYIAYEPATDGALQMIQINEKDDIRRYYQDFSARISYMTDIDDAAYYCNYFTPEQLLENISLFGLKASDKDVLAIIHDIDKLIADYKETSAA